MSNLFPSHLQNQPGGGTVILSFNAGMCNLSAPNAAGKIVVTPDTRRCRITLESGSDSLLHFRLVDRSNGACSLDRIIFPHEVEFKKVRTGTDTDRVFQLKLGGNQRFLYWMQDKSADKDEENCRKMNKFCNDPMGIQIFSLIANMFI